MADRCTDTWYWPLLICDQTTPFAAQSDFSYEVKEVVIDCVVLFYEEERGVGNYRKKNKFSCRVNMQEKRLVKFREAI